MHVTPSTSSGSTDFSRGVDIFDQNTFTPTKLIGRIIKSYLKPQWKRLTVSFLAMIFTAATTGALPFLIQQVTDRVFIGKNPDFLYILPVLVMVIMLLRASAEFIARITQARISCEVIGHLRQDMFKKITHADLNYLEAMHSGRFSAIFSTDVGLVNSAAAGTLTALVKNGLTACFLVGAMFVLDWVLSILVLFGTPAALYFMAKQRKKIRVSVRGQLRETGGLSSLILQSIKNIRIIKAHNQEKKEQTRFNASIRQIIRLLMRQNRAQSVMGPMTEALTGVGFAAAIFYGGWQGIHGAITPGDFIGFMTAAMLAYQPLKSLAALQGQLTQGTEAANRVFSLIDYTPRITQNSTAPQLKTSKGEITFDKVSFSYDNTVSAVQDFSFRIPAGQKVALVGPSGSGKTTLMHLVMRFFDPDQGRILIDSQDIKQCELASVREACALLTQEPLLFDDTILANIGYGKETASQTDIKKAATAADAHQFIEKLPNAYDTQVGEAGALLSGGQKQRIAIARALLKNAPILLLDEPTSALDSGSEARIQQALDTLFKNRTVLMIAHRLSTVQNADLICVLDQGRLIETGNHKTLLAKDGLYAQFCHVQFGNNPKYR